MASVMNHNHMKDKQLQIVTVGDQVRLTKDLMGTVRFVGEIQGRCAYTVVCS